MHGVVGDRIIIESERVGLSARTGEILEVHESPLGADYRVRWDDGRVTEIRPIVLRWRRPTIDTVGPTPRSGPRQEECPARSSV